MGNHESQSVRKDDCKSSNAFMQWSKTGSQPLLVFINPRSGGQKGECLYACLQQILGPDQVRNLNDDKGPDKGLEIFRDIPSFRIVVCGGDGTVGWVLQSLDNYQWTNTPAIAVIPLGTGNDMARTLKWGGGIKKISIPALQKWLSLISQASIVTIDRWTINITASNENDITAAAIDLPVILNKNFTNYFSVGVDASIALDFHTQRHKNASAFTGVHKNKCIYMGCGLHQMFFSVNKNLQDDVRLLVDDAVPFNISRFRLQGLQLININSMYGGCDIWGKVANKNSRKSGRQGRFHSQDCSDQVIELVGIKSASHAGLCAAKLTKGIRLVQCGRLSMSFNRSVDIQLDGEPYKLPAGYTVNIMFKDKVNMLRKECISVP